MQEALMPGPADVSLPGAYNELKGVGNNVSVCHRRCHLANTFSRCLCSVCLPCLWFGECCGGSSGLNNGVRCHSEALCSLHGHEIFLRLSKAVPTHRVGSKLFANSLTAKSQGGESDPVFRLWLVCSNCQLKAHSVNGCGVWSSAPAPGHH